MNNIKLREWFRVCNRLYLESELQVANWATFEGFSLLNVELTFSLWVDQVNVAKKDKRRKFVEFNIY